MRHEFVLANVRRRAAGLMVAVALAVIAVALAVIAAPRASTVRAVQVAAAGAADSTGVPPTAPSPPAALASVPAVVEFGRFGAVHLYATTARPKNVVLFVSGDGGWNQGVVDMAHDLAALDALVAGIDITHYLTQLAAAKESCLYPAADFEALSQFVQKKLDYPRYTKPVLVGYSSGATLVYAVLVQGPSSTFKGAISLGFCPDLQGTKPFCKGSGLEFSVDAKHKSLVFKPARDLEVPWIALQGTIDQVCDPAGTETYVRKVPGAELVLLPKVGHGYSVPRNWLPQFEAAFKRVIATPDHSEPPPAEVEQLGDLPLNEVPAQGPATDQMALLLTGDGGYGVTDKGIANALAGHGIPVVVLNSQHYFWQPKTPEGLAHDTERIVRHYLDAWRKQRVIYVGYSHGADVLPFALNRVPVEVRTRTQVVCLLGVAARADFEFHMMDLIRAPKRPTALATLPELEQLRGMRMLVFYGTDDEETIGPGLDSTLVEKHALATGHRIGSNYEDIVSVLLRETKE